MCRWLARGVNDHSLAGNKSKTAGLTEQEFDQHEREGQLEILLGEKRAIRGGMENDEFTVRAIPRVRHVEDEGHFSAGLKGDTENLIFG